MSTPSEQQLRQMLLEYMDGNLSPDVVQQLNARLATDLDMRRFFARLLLQEIHLAEIGQEEIAAKPVSVTEPVLAQITRPAMDVSWWANPRLAWLGVLMVVVFAVGVTLTYFTRERLLLSTALDVTISRKGRTLPAKDGMVLQLGDTVTTSKDGEATIRYRREGTQFVLKTNTEFRLLPRKRFELSQGSVEVRVHRHPAGESVVVATPQAEVKVVGTEFLLAVENGATRLEVLEGKVRLSNIIDRASIDVAAGQSAIAAPDVELAAQPNNHGRGSILREYWTEVRGRTLDDLISHPNFPDRPSGSDYRPDFEGPSQWADFYGTRMRGYLYPPETGSYIFWIAGDDEAELWLSPDDSPDRKVKICSTGVYTAEREWTKDPKQQSSVVKLVAGRKYYIEVLHYEHGGGDCLAAAWQIPRRERAVIGGEFLSPFQTRQSKNSR